MIHVMIHVMMQHRDEPNEGARLLRSLLWQARDISLLLAAAALLGEHGRRGVYIRHHGFWISAIQAFVAFFLIVEFDL